MTTFADAGPFARGRIPASTALGFLAPQALCPWQRAMGGRHLCGIVGGISSGFRLEMFEDGLYENRS